MTLVLHYHPLSSYCWKALIALEENGAPYEARLVEFGDPKAKAAFAALWPTAKIPLLEDAGTIVPETSILIEHVDRAHPGKIKLLPDDPRAQLEVRLWDRLFDLYVMTPVQRFVADELRPEAERDARTRTEMKAALSAAYDMIEGKLKGRAFAAGEAFTLADCAAAPALFYAQTIVPFPPGHATLGAYFERLMARPSFARVLERARPYFRYFPLAHALPARFRPGAD